jgi:hypothetical protein
VALNLYRRHRRDCKAGHPEELHTCEFEERAWKHCGCPIFASGDAVGASRPRTAIERAVKTFLDELQETAAFATHKKYRLLLTKLIEFSAQRGYVMIDQSDPTDVREFRTSWAINPQTRALRMSMLKPFFEYCVANEWIGRKGPSAFRRGGSRLQSGS